MEYMEGLILVLIVVTLGFFFAYNFKDVICSRFIKDHKDDPVDGGEFGNKLPIAVKRKTKKKIDKVVKPRKKVVRKKTRKKTRKKRRPKLI
jgi:hypothetical protein